MSEAINSFRAMPFGEIDDQDELMQPTVTEEALKTMVRNPALN